MKYTLSLVMKKLVVIVEIINRYHHSFQNFICKLDILLSVVTRDLVHIMVDVITRVIYKQFICYTSQIYQ